MNKIFLCCLAACMLCFSGCGALSTTWVSDTKGQEEMESDMAACSYELEKLEVRHDVDNVKHSIMLEDCMKAKGWRRG